MKRPQSHASLSLAAVVRRAAVASLLASTALSACGGGVITQRDVDEPRGVTRQHGPPKNAKYQSTVEVERDVLRVTVIREAECEVIKVRTVARSEETLEDGEVVSRRYVGPVQVTEGTEGTVPCDKTFGRDLRVTMKIGDATFDLGPTSERGVLAINLSDRLRQSLYGPAGQVAEAELFVDDPRDVEGLRPAGTVSLAQLNLHEKRVNELIEEMRALLEKDPSEHTPAEIARSYEIYSQLQQINAGDARIEGLEMRFLEQFFLRKDLEATERFRRNLKALDEAKNVLAALAAQPQAIPIWVHNGIDEGTLNSRLVNWARGQAILGLRGTPSLCGNRFKWPNASSGLPASQQLGFHYLRYAYGDSYSTNLSGVCKKVSGW